VCVNPTYVAQCRTLLRGSPVKLCCVVGFPLGASRPRSRPSKRGRQSARGRHRDRHGDHIGALKSKDEAAGDPRHPRRGRSCRDGRALSKVIFETALLTDDEKVRACELSMKAGRRLRQDAPPGSRAAAPRPRTSPSWPRRCAEKLGVKASGGIRTYDDAVRMIEAGATRIGREREREDSGRGEGAGAAEGIARWPSSRCYVFLDSLQPQYASFLGTVAQGFLPTPGEASLFVEIAPGMDIMRVTDVALKATHVKPGMLIIERLYGIARGPLRIARPTCRAAGRAILDLLWAEGRGADEAGDLLRARSSGTSRLSLPHAAHQPDAPRRHDHAGPVALCDGVAPAGYAALAANRGGEGGGHQHPGGPRVRQFRPRCTSAAKSATSMWRTGRRSRQSERDRKK